MEDLSLSRWSLVSYWRVGGGPVCESLVGDPWVVGESVDRSVVGGLLVVGDFLTHPVLKQAHSLTEFFLISCPKHIISTK